MSYRIGRSRVPCEQRPLHTADSDAKNQLRNEPPICRRSSYAGTGIPLVAPINTQGVDQADDPSQNRQRGAWEFRGLMSELIVWPTLNRHLSPCRLHSRAGSWRGTVAALRQNVFPAAFGRQATVCQENFAKWRPFADADPSPPSIGNRQIADCSGEQAHFASSSTESSHSARCYRLRKSSWICRRNFRIALQ